MCSCKEKLDSALDEVTNLKKRLHELQEQMAILRHNKYGKRSETSNSLQLQLTIFDDAADDVTETVTPISPEMEEVSYKRKKRSGKNGRNIDTSTLPRETVIHDLSDGEKQCSCGKCLIKISEDKIEKIEFIPASLKVIEHITLKYACKSCEAIKSATKPATAALAKCMAGNSLIAEVIISKYENHLPLYRQSKIWQKQGLDIPDNTMGNWVMGAAEALEPLGNAMWQQINNIRLLQADETPVKILKPDKKGYIWVYQSLDEGNKFIRFEFSETRSGSVPNARLKNFSGILQTDGYAGYNQMRTSENIITLGCWDHARRYFTNALKIYGNKKTGLIGKMLQLIGELYKVERDYKDSSMAERYAARQEKSKDILLAIFTQVGGAIPAPGALAKAITYLRNNKTELMRYIDYGDTQISNCLTEN
jgi:transposase